MIKPTNGVATALAALLATSAVAQEMDYGNFDGYVLRVKLIGGAQYEPLYAEIPKWEEMTGATVDVLSRKNHFELDREIKQGHRRRHSRLVRRIQPYQLRAANTAESMST